MEDQNKTPRTGGGDVQKSPRTGGGDHNKMPANPSSSKSAPTEAPGVRSGITIPQNGDQYTPTSMKMNEKVEPVQPPKGSTGN